MNEASALYQEAIKQMAQAAHGQGQLDGATGEAKLDNPLCGDRVRMQVVLDGGRIAAIVHQTKGCLLCRAAASLVGQRAPGSDEAGIAATADALEHLLRDGTPAPGQWPELALFEPARAYPSRHKCVLLPFRALQAALRNAAAASSTGDHRGK
ncbi:MAG: iron-sulfur cluster assembly scaffold protein [Betaproteobacteria bacterium]|nr:iron-sulfur cluster assembly scaffold protein [Betaproteobacteria bacterium]